MITATGNSFRSTAVQVHSDYTGSTVQYCITNMTSARRAKLQQLFREIEREFVLLEEVRPKEVLEIRLSELRDID